jgi:hypothetical protein
VPEDERKGVARGNGVIGKPDVGVAEPTTGDLDDDLAGTRPQRRQLAV